MAENIFPSQQPHFIMSTGSRIAKTVNNEYVQETFSTHKIWKSLYMCRIRIVWSSYVIGNQTKHCSVQGADLRERGRWGWGEGSIAGTVIWGDGCKID